MASYIGYNNLVRSGTVTTSGDAAGYPKENAQSWKTSAWWQADVTGTVYYYIDFGSAVAFDCMGVAGHNLADNSGSIQLQYSTTGAWAGEEVNVGSNHAPTTNVTIFETFGSVSARYARFVVNSTGAASYIGNLFIGAALALEREVPPPFSPANYNRDRKILNNTSQGGQFMGRIIQHKGAKIKIEQKLVTVGWIETYWEALADHVELYPFYYQWSSDKPTEVAYCIANQINYPQISQSGFMDFAFDCTAVYDL